MNGLRPPVAFAIVALATLVAYLPSFNVPFQFDDYGRIVDNPGLRDGDWGAGIRWLGMSRPIPSATLALNYRLGHDATLGYHLVNFLVHLLATLGVFRLALELCATPALRDGRLVERRTAFAALAALLFACHPIQTQAVTYIIQRSTAMAGMFYVWSLAVYVRARNRAARGEDATGGFVFCTLLGLCAVASKESAVTLPVAILLTEGMFFGLRGKTRRILRFAFAALLFLALPIGWKALTSRPMKSGFDSLPWWSRLVQGLFAQGAPEDLTVTSFQYFLTQMTVLPRYLRLVLIPFAFNVDHDVAIQDGASPAVIAGGAILCGLAAVGWLLASRRPVLGFAIFFFFVAMSVESSLLPIADLMMEHRMYLAMAGIALALSASMLRWAHGERAVVASGALLLLLLPSLTFARNLAWQTPLSLWTDALDQSPRKARVHVNLGVAYHGLHRLDDAIRHYCIALDLDPEIAVARDNLEIALDEQGKLQGVIDQLMRGSQKVAKAPDGSMLLEYDVARISCPSILRQARATSEDGDR